MNSIKIYKKLLKFFITINLPAFLLLLMVVLIESFVSILTVISIAPFADFLSDPSLSNVNAITERFLAILDKLEIHPSLLIFGIIFIVFNVLRAIMDIVLRYSTIKIKYLLIEKINTDLVSNLLNAKWSFFKTLSQGKIINTLTRETNAVGDTMGIMCTQLASMIKFVVLITFPVMLYPSFMLTLIGLILIMMMPYLLLQKLTYKLGKKTTQTSNKSIEKLSEIIRTVKPIKSFLKEAVVADVYRKILKSHFVVSIKSHTLSHAVYTSYQTLGIAAIIITTIFHESLLISEMAVIIWSMIQSLPMIGRVLSSNTAIINFFPSFEQLDEINTNTKKLKEQQGGKNIKKITTVELEKVNYQIDEKEIIKGIDLSFKKGTVTALCGKSGSGKTSLAEIIMSFITPSSGNVRFNGDIVESLNVSSLRKRISYCSQETLLFSGTIFDNLAFVKSDITTEEAFEALKFADAYEMVMTLDDGLMADIGEYGASMSGGEKQKISLARTYLMKPDVYIFDEITAAIDKISEEKIYKNIKKLSQNAIVIFITHNVHALKIADEIHFIQKGKLLSSGDFRFLKAKVKPFQMFLKSAEL